MTGNTTMEEVESIGKDDMHSTVETRITPSTTSSVEQVITQLDYEIMGIYLIILGECHTILLPLANNNRVNRGSVTH